MTRVLEARRDGYHRALERLFESGSAVGLSEAELLDRFACYGDESAFEALVERHGPMVLGVCRRHLRDPNDVDDAFQAVFLVLFRKAGTLRRKELLGAWLYGVARKVAIRARSLAAVREARVGSTADGEALGVDARRSPSPDPAESVGRDEGNARLHQEIDRLPWRYRAPVVACYFEGRTHEEAAELLGWPLGTVKGRLARARDLLRKRLERQGVAVSPAVLLGRLSSPALRPTVPPSLVSSTIQSALMTAESLSIPIQALVEGALKAMILARAKAVAPPLSLVAAGLFAIGGSVAAHQGKDQKAESQDKPPAEAKPDQGDPNKADEKKADADKSEHQKPQGFPGMMPFPGTGMMMGPGMMGGGAAPGMGMMGRGGMGPGMMGGGMAPGMGRMPGVPGTSGRMGFGRLPGMPGASGTPGFGGFPGAGAQGFGGFPAAGAQGFGGFPGMPGAAGAHGFGGFPGAGAHGFGGFPGMPGAAGAQGFGGFPGAGAHGFGGFPAAGAQGFGGFPGKPGEAEESEKAGEPGKPGAFGAFGVPGMMGPGPFHGRSPGELRQRIAGLSATIAKNDESPETKAALEALDQPFKLSTSEKSTLGEVIKQIKESLTTADGKKVPVHVDLEGIKRAKASLDSPVSIDLEGAPLKTSLRLLLKPIDLAYCVRDGVVIISSLDGVLQELREAESELQGLHPDKAILGPGGQGFMGSPGGMR